MIRLLLLILFFFLAYTGYQIVLRSLSRRSLPRDKSPQGEEMVRDPQCGTYVPRSSALEKSIDGRKHYFCSSRCRELFTGKK